MNRALHAIAFALCIAGCATAPVTLVTLPPVAAVDADPAPGASVMLREVRLPGYLDGFPVVLGRDGGALVVSGNAEWAEHLSIGATRALRDALAHRLGTARVVIPGEGRTADAELAVEFLALDPQDGAVQLDARWFYACAGGGGRGDRTRLQVPTTGATASAVAAATGQALARFGAVLAAALPCTAARKVGADPDRAAAAVATARAAGK